MVERTSRAIVAEVFAKAHSDQRNRKGQKLHNGHENPLLAGMTHSGRQQVVRVDREPAAAPNGHITHELTVAARKYAGVSDGCWFPDMGMEPPRPVIVTAIRAKQKFGQHSITVDSRARCWSIAAQLRQLRMSRRSKLRYALTLAMTGRSWCRRRPDHCVDEAAVVVDNPAGTAWWLSIASTSR